MAVREGVLICFSVRPASRGDGESSCVTEQVLIANLLQ